MDTNCLLFHLVFIGVSDQNAEIAVVTTVKKSPKLFREAQALVQLELMAVVHASSCKYLKQLKAEEESSPNINSWKVTKQIYLILSKSNIMTENAENIPYI